MFPQFGAAKSLVTPSNHEWGTHTETPTNQPTSQSQSMVPVSVALLYDVWERRPFQLIRTRDGVCAAAALIGTAANRGTQSAGGGGWRPRY